jgi:hypothetical protein
MSSTKLSTYVMNNLENALRVKRITPYQRSAVCRSGKKTGPIRPVASVQSLHPVSRFNWAQPCAA